MENNKNLYDYTNEELKNRLENEFQTNYSKYNYSFENWELLNKIVSEFNETILETSFPLALYNETKYKLSQVESLKKEKAFGEVFIDSLFSVFSTIKKSVSILYNAIKFVFSILGLTIASVIITIFIHLILGTFIYAILPKNVTPLMVQSIISGILFIIFKVLLFLDKDDKDVLNNYKLEIIKFSCTIPFYCLIFLIFKFMNTIPVLEEFIPLFYPHMWLSSFTGEYVFSPMISLCINCFISIIIYVIIKKRSEY